MGWFEDNSIGVTDPNARDLFPGYNRDIENPYPGASAPLSGIAPAGTGAGIPWEPGASQPSASPDGYTWSTDQARFIPTTGATATSGDPLRQFVLDGFAARGIQPRDEEDIQYWMREIQKTGGLENAGNKGYWFNRLRADQGGAGDYLERPESGGALGSLSGQFGGFGGFGGYIAPFTGQFAAPTAAEAEATPGYQFSRDQGLQAIDRSAAAKGTLLTGGTLKDLAGYAGGIASQNYNNVFNQGLQTFNTNRDTFYHNQDSPFSKLYNVAALGRPTTP